MTSSLEEAVQGVGLIVPAATLVLYGSRVRQTAKLTSDWDFVALIDYTTPFEKRTVHGDLDILQIAWKTTEQPQWYKREICALLMSDSCSVWLDPSKKPSWHVDWLAIITEKERRVRNAIRLYHQHRNLLSAEAKTKHLLRIRRWAQRVETMRAHREVISTPEIDAMWAKYSWTEQDNLLTRFGADRGLCGDADQYT